MKESDDAALLPGLRARDPAAFERLVTTYQHRMFCLAYRMLGDRGDAADAAQEAFLRVFRGIEQFRGEAKLSTWLHAITSRICLNHLSARRRLMATGRQEDEQQIERLPTTADDPARTAERRELEAALDRAIAELPEHHRLIVVLRDIQGLAYEDIAQTLGLELGTVRSRLHRARMELKDKLEKFLS